MKNPLFVQILDAFGDLVDDGNGLFLGHASILEQLGFEIALRGEFEEEVDIVRSFGEISELDDVLVGENLPGTYLIFQGGDKILFCLSLMLAGIDLFDQMFLGYHFASQFLSIAVVNGEESLCKTSLPQFLVLYQVLSIHDLHGLYSSRCSWFFFVVFAFNHFFKAIIIIMTLSMT